MGQTAEGLLPLPPQGHSEQRAGALPRAEHPQVKEEPAQPARLLASGSLPAGQAARVRVQLPLAWHMCPLLEALKHGHLCPLPEPGVETQQEWPLSPSAVGQGATRHPAAPRGACTGLLQVGGLLFGVGSPLPVLLGDHRTEGGGKQLSSPAAGWTCRRTPGEQVRQH